MCRGNSVEIHDYSNDKDVGNKYFHADYIFDCQNELGVEYFDKPL